MRPEASDTTTKESKPDTKHSQKVQGKAVPESGWKYLEY